ncbi:hypothetical protein B0H34DRAFT_631042, partial [Crassisporium funariophilum]
RYRQVPTFGRAIRRFTSNASGMKKLAGCDFEDLLQCAIPIFKGLLDDKNNTIVLDLLFELATWHGLAKLHLHTTATVSSLEASTTRLGAALRKFQDVTCKEFPKVDLPSEEAARAQHKAAVQKRAGTIKGRKLTSHADLKGKGKAPAAATRTFNLASYKPHALGDYAEMICLYG